MEMEELYSLMAEFKKSGLGKLELEKDGFSVKLEAPRPLPPESAGAPGGAPLVLCIPPLSAGMAPGTPAPSPYMAQAAAAAPGAFPYQAAVAAAPSYQTGAAPTTAAAPAPGPGQSADLYIRSPLVGTFYAGPGPDLPPFTAAGAKLKKGDVVCIVEAMKMMNEVTASCDCIIEEVLKEDGAAAGYDEPLFRIREI